MSNDIFDETKEKYNTLGKASLDTKPDIYEKRKFKKWVLSKTKKHILSDRINTKKNSLQLFFHWVSISLLLMLSITVLFVGIIFIFSRFKESIPSSFIPWIYASAYIVSLLLVFFPFFFWYKRKRVRKEKNNAMHDT